MGISEITVKAHRGKVIQEMTADSLANLVKTAVRLGLVAARNLARPGARSVMVFRHPCSAELNQGVDPLILPNPLKVGENERG